MQYSAHYSSGKTTFAMYKNDDMTSRVERDITHPLCVCCSRYFLFTDLHDHVSARESLYPPFLQTVGALPHPRLSVNNK